MISSYFADSRPDIQALVDAQGRRVLDVGCGAGALGAALRDRGAARVVGIEVNPEAAAAASAVLDHVVTAPVDDIDTESLGQFDVIVFADVLEHLPDPAYTLRKLLAVLVPGGQVVVSVPNIRFWSVLLRLVVDRWSYTDSGVRDRTHLRIFTRRSLLDLLDEVGLVPERTVRRQRLYEDQSRIGRPGVLATRAVLATLGRTPLRELLTFQYVTVCRRRQPA